MPSNNPIFAPATSIRSINLALNQLANRLSILETNPPLIPSGGTVTPPNKNIDTTPDTAPVTTNVLFDNGTTLSRPPTLLNGTTSGSLKWTMPIQQTGYKVFVLVYNGYKNTTGVSQTITFPVSFTTSPLVVYDNNSVSNPVTASITVLTLPNSMSGSITGGVFIVGF